MEITRNRRDTGVYSMTLLEKHTEETNGYHTQQQSKLRATGDNDEHTKRDIVQRKKEYSLIPILHSKPPKSTVADAATTTRTPGIRVVQGFVFWANDFHPTIYPGHGFTRLLSNGGVIGSDVSEHLLRYNRLETHRSWISWLLVGFILHKH